MVEHGDKNLPACCLQRIRGHAKADTAHESGTFLIVSPSESRLFVQFGRRWPYCCRLSTHQLFSLCSQIASIQEAKLDSGARRAGCDLCARNAAYMTDWEGAGSPSCLCPVLCADLSQGTFAPEQEQILSSGVYTGMGHWLLWK